MAPKKKSSKVNSASSPKKGGTPPAPFKEPPEVLQPFIEQLDKEHIYITHIDSKPATFKRKIFMVPVAMSLAVVAAFVGRMYYILPYYFKILVSSLGHDNETTFPIYESSWDEIAWEIGRRAFSFIVDFLLVVFVWPWPVEFVAGINHGNPCKWRWNVGFREKEIYVRRSRDWDKVLEDIFIHENSNKVLMAYIKQATSPMVVEQKTGYLLMNAQWDLDWDAIILAHKLVDKKDIALEAFRNVTLVHHEAYGWMCYDDHLSISADADEKRRHIFAFRDALVSMGKEKLFYRWVEIVQFEASQPGGFGPEKQEAAAKQIRDLFAKDDIDFDVLWKDAVGVEAPDAI